MNTSAYTIYSIGKSKLSLAFLFALAVLLLVVSCPLKRLLQSNDMVYTSKTTKASQTNISTRSAAQHSSIENCCAIKKKAVFVKSGLSQKVVAFAPSYLSTVSDASGFDINYYLSGINYNSAQVEINDPSSLPHFLQHLRLRI